MKRIIILFLAGMLFAGSAIAQTNGQAISHIVEPGQTLFFISKKYNLSIDELRAANPEIGDDLIIRPDDILVINPKLVTVPSGDTQYEMYTVTSKETLYSLSKKFGTSVDALIQMNALESPSIQIGQVLRVRQLDLNKEALFAKTEATPTVQTPQVVLAKPQVDYKKPADVASKLDQVNVNEMVTVAIPKAPKVGVPSGVPSINTDKQPKNVPAISPAVSTTPTKEKDSDLYKLLFDSYEGSGKALMKDKGIGNFLNSGDDNSYLALVEGVPQGQVIKVRNLMNNNVVYLKVVGSVPANEQSKNVSLKISKAAAADLKILEDRFLAEWSYYDVQVVPPPATEIPEKKDVYITDF